MSSYPTDDLALRLLALPDFHRFALAIPAEDRANPEIVAHYPGWWILPPTRKESDPRRDEPRSGLVLRPTAAIAGLTLPSRLGPLLFTSPDVVSRRIAAGWAFWPADGLAWLRWGRDTFAEGSGSDWEALSACTDREGKTLPESYTITEVRDDPPRVGETFNGCDARAVAIGAREEMARRERRDAEAARETAAKETAPVSAVTPAENARQERTDSAPTAAPALAPTLASAFAPPMPVPVSVPTWEIRSPPPPANPNLDARIHRIMMVAAGGSVIMRADGDRYARVETVDLAHGALHVRPSVGFAPDGKHHILGRSVWIDPVYADIVPVWGRQPEWVEDTRGENGENGGGAR